MKVFINDDNYTKQGFKISTDKSLLDIDIIYQYLDKESYWSQGIPLEKLKKGIENSMCFGIYKDDKQVGFARVITDNAVFAYLCDVFVLTNYRGLGLSKWLLQTIKNHPELQGLRRWTLATVDAHGLYSQFGFTPLTNTDRWMGIYTPYNP
ncbi:MAG: N-acetyltransferase [Sphingobacteriaceae bacterium]|nr:MAG: N-acetyltransferase [Sphingobacteriaceae bacterium]